MTAGEAAQEGNYRMTSKQGACPGEAEGCDWLNHNNKITTVEKAQNRGAVHFSMCPNHPIEIQRKKERTELPPPHKPSWLCKPRVNRSKETRAKL